MTLAELIGWLDQRTDHTFLAGTAQESLEQARSGSHPDPIAAEVLAAIAEGCGCETAEGPVERAAVVTSLGPLRLKYQADDAPVEGFRLMREAVIAVDEAFDNEALAQKAGS